MLTALSGTLAGQVVDSDNAAIVGAQVKTRGQNGSAVIRLVTDQSGRAGFTALPTGTYELRVQHDGSREQTRVVQLAAESGAIVTVPLAVSTLTQTVTVQGQSSIIIGTPRGQTQQRVSREDFKNRPATTFAKVLDLVPGVTFVQRNAPRNISISVRGSNERQTYGVRNIQMFGDGFSVTQPDGLTRTDLTEPHSYSSIDVVQGTSSSLHRNYATDGALNFHTRSGSEIQGLEVGADFGSLGYFNDHAIYAVGNQRFQVSAFLSNFRATQATANNQFNTITGNILGPFAATPHDRFTFKFLNNDLDTNLSIRLPLAQSRLNPYQSDCEIYSAAAAANECASAGLFNDGYNFSYPVGATPASSPVAADRTFCDVAAEVSTQYHPEDAVRPHARLGTGYGTPQPTQLFTTAQSGFGNNTTLLSTHHDPPAGHGAPSKLRFYFDIQNLANRTYVALASSITCTRQQNSSAVLTTSTGSVYAGTPHGSYGGVRVRF
jgi:iron complex outermembrane receptor protein